MDHDPNAHSPRPDPSRVLAALSLRRTLTALRTLSEHPHSPSLPGPDQPRSDPHCSTGHRRRLPLPLLVLGLSTALVATTTTVWALAPWWPWWALTLTAPIAAVTAFVLGTIALAPFLVSMTRSGQGSPTGHQWIAPTALTFAACALPLLSPAAPWCNALGHWTLLGASMLVSTYITLPTLGRDIELDQARIRWDPPTN